MNVREELFEATRERVRRGGSKAKIRPHEFVIVTRSAEEYFDLLYMFVYIQSMYLERKFNKIRRELPDTKNVLPLFRKMITEYKKVKMKMPVQTLGSAVKAIKKEKWRGGKI